MSEPRGTVAAGTQAASPLPVTSAPAGSALLLTMRGITKRFGATQALAGADLVLAERQVHGLVGTSGAGKTTLVDVLSGMCPFDEGAVVYRGYPIRLRGRRDAWRIGIGVAAQDATLVPDLSVLDNILLPAWRRVSRQGPDELRRRAEGVLESLGWTAALPLAARGSALSATQRRLLEIARLLFARAKLYVFDEPFAGLSSRDLDALLATLNRLRLGGCGILIASRRLDDVVGLADRVTVLSEGRTAVLAETTAQPANLGAAMGAPPPRAAPSLSTAGNRPALGLRGLVTQAAPEPLDLALAPGEVHALWGAAEGAATAVLQAVAGVARPRAGSVALDGAPLRPGSPAAAAAGGIALLPADAALPLPRGSARQNLALRGRPGAGWALDELWDVLGLPADALDAPAHRQPEHVRRRIALACALQGGWRAVLLDAPARGLHAEERRHVRAAVLAAAARGCAVLAAWTEPDDLLAVSGRVTVLRAGARATTLPAAALDREALDLAAASTGSVGRLLAELTRENGGAAFWVLRRDGHVLCLAAELADADADPGLVAAESRAFGQTRIAAALARGESRFVAEPDGTRATMLVPIRGPRGQPFGLIGLTLASADRLPPASAVAFRIETMASRL